MSEQHSEWEKQWGELLSHAYGEEVEARPEFRAGLLAKLKAKTAGNKSEADTDTAAAADVNADADTDADANWRKLLSATCPPCEPRAEFKSSLLTRLKQRQQEVVEDANWRTLLTATHPACEARPEFKSGLLAELKQKQQEQAVQSTSAEAITTETNDEDAVRKLITSSYTPVQPRKEFETRLLVNLKQRQRDTHTTRSNYRRRTIYLSGLSSMAAAAMVMFVVWIMPGGKLEQPTGQGQILASGPMETVLAPAEREVVMANTSLGKSNASPVNSSALLPAAAVVAAAGSYRVAEAFASFTLPQTVRGIGMQINDGDGWRNMDETMLARVEPGMQFRPDSNTARSGLGFSDGSTFLVFPESLIAATDNGFTMREGEMAVTVPDNSDSRFRLHFPERDIAIEPGTMMTVAVESPDNYAEGGAPAPVVKVLGGGMALAMGRNGAGPLLANQVYELDKYVTPDIPGRPLCAVETQELRRLMNPVGVEMAAAGGPSFDNTGMQMVSSAAVAQAANRPATPEGFVKKGNRWQAKNYQNQPTIRIQYLSDAYFGFANERRDLADALALGGEVILDGNDGNFYEIYR